MDIRAILIEQSARVKIQAGISDQRAIEEAIEEVTLILTLKDLEQRGLFGILSTAIH